jgi:glycosyltransferase involved in cell wall biosynthesis
MRCAPQGARSVRIAVAYDCLFPWTKGGGEKQYRTFAEEFVAAGHEVTYLTRQQWDDGETPEIDGIAIEAISRDRALYDEHGVRLLAPALRFAAGLFAHLCAHRRHYDAVLLSGTPATNVHAARAALVGSVVVLCVDWLEVWRAKQWREYSGALVGTLANTLQSLAIRLSPMASCHSQFTAIRLRERGLSTEPVISPGLMERRSLGAPELSPPGPPKVVYVGRHIADKRVEAIPAALAYARRQIPDLRATIFGDGPSQVSLRKEIDRWGVGPAVTMPGFVDQAELDRAIRNAACLVNPSAREGYGLVVVEACAAATPVVLVAGEDNAAVELIDEGINGCVAASIEPEVLGQAIVDVVRAGATMRAKTHAWFEAVCDERSVSAAARQIAARLEQAVKNI